MLFFNETVSDKITESVRLDVYISSNIENMNRSKLKSGVSNILVNGKSAKLSQKVKAKDQISFNWEDSVPQDIIPQDIPLDIIYEDENVTVINKKCGMVTHPASGNWENTLVNALLFHWGRSAIKNESEITPQSIEARRPGIIHRLDKDTSGVIITAKNRETEEFLSSQFRNHNSISKIYICICKGHPPAKEGIIRTNLDRDINDRKKFKVFEEGDKGKLAVTKFKCISCYGPYSLMKVRIFTGRTHQIRVHMKFIGCPILGDPIYSKTSKDSVIENTPLMLHAYKLKIKIPGSDELKTFVAKVPLRFKKVLKKLHENFSKSDVPQKHKPNGDLIEYKAKKGYGQWQNY